MRYLSVYNNLYMDIGQISFHKNEQQVETYIQIFLDNG